MKHGLLSIAIFIASLSATAADFEAPWKRSRSWIGPEVWANPLQDWKLKDGTIVARVGGDRSLHLLTHQLSREAKSFALEVFVRFSGPISGGSPLLGFGFGLHGDIDDFRHALIWSTEGARAGLRGDGRLQLGEVRSEDAFDVLKPVRLILGVDAEGHATLTGSQGDATRSIEAQMDSASMHGNLALVALSGGKSSGGGNLMGHFSDWSVRGPRVTEHLDQAFGTLLWSQYTLSKGVLKLSAQLAPLQKAGCTEVRLQFKKEGAWVDHGAAPIDTLSRTALFRVDWPKTDEDTDYRLTHQWQGKDYHWSGTIRPEPAVDDPITIGVFSCDHGYAFPHRRMTANVRTQNPDLVFFAGDQIYEGYGGFGVARIDDTEAAMLDYLRKYYQFGWSWREVLKDRPSVIIPDDHDVFQGNLWGQGGRSLPETQSGKRDFASGGYLMPAEWVNAVQRTQVANLPDPVDPEPVEQGIEVYFTGLDYGAARIAILEDRKFKTGPASLFEGNSRRGAMLDELDVEGAEMLGERQEAFLRDWREQGGNGKIPVVLSQTLFCKATTHTGQALKPSGVDLDCGGWPQTARNRALKILGSGVVMLHGDQHLGALVHHGVHDWEDGPIGFMAPGTANGFPRAWWPKESGENHQPGQPEWTGRYFDGLGNRMTMIAAANPEPGSNQKDQQGAWTSEEMAHYKGSGHGIVRLDPIGRTVTFEMWRYRFDAATPKPTDQFEGFPKTLSLKP